MVIRTPEKSQAGSFMSSWYSKVKDYAFMPWPQMLLNLAVTQDQKDGRQRCRTKQGILIKIAKTKTIHGEPETYIHINSWQSNKGNAKAIYTQGLTG